MEGNYFLFQNLSLPLCPDMASGYLHIDFLGQFVTHLCGQDCQFIDKALNQHCRKAGWFFFNLGCTLNIMI